MIPIRLRWPLSQRNAARLFLSAALVALLAGGMGLFLALRPNVAWKSFLFLLLGAIVIGLTTSKGSRRNVIAINVGVIVIFFGSQILVPLPAVGRNLTLATLSLMVLLPPVLVPRFSRARHERRKARFGHNSSLWLTLFLLYAAMITFSTSSDLMKDITRFGVVLGIGAALFWVAQSGFLSFDSIERTARLLVFLATLVSAYAILEFVVESNVYLDKIIGTAYSSQFVGFPYRSAAVFANSNHLGGVLILCLPLAVAQARNAWLLRRSPWLGWICVLAIVGAIYTTGSRSAYAGMLFLGLLYYWDWIRGRETRRILAPILRWGFSVLLSLFLVLGVVNLFNQASLPSSLEGSLVTRIIGPLLYGEDNIGLTYRIAQPRLVGRLLVKTNGLGVGLRDSRGLAREHLSYLNRLFEEETSDSQYLTLAADFGIPGVLFWVLFYALVVVLGWKGLVSAAINKDERRLEWLRALLFVVITMGGVMVGQDILYFEDVGRVLLILMGMLVAAANEVRQSMIVLSADAGDAVLSERKHRVRGHKLA